MKKKVSLKHTPVNFRGEPIGEVSLGQICAEAVIGTSNRSTSVVKLYAMAQELYSQGEVTLDPPDLQLLREVVESSDKIILMAKAQILLAIDNAVGAK